MEKSQLKSQVISIILVATALILFVVSAFQYEKYGYFYILLTTRIIMVLTGYIIAILLMMGKIKSPKIETHYFLFCLMMQSLHGILEGASSTAFYSFTGPWLILCSLSLQENFNSWFKKTFPLQFIGFIIPMFFKNADYFKSVGTFVDSFSLPLSGMFVGLVLAKITSDRYEAIAEKLLLEKKLNDALSTNLNNEIKFRSAVEDELKEAKAVLVQTAKLRVISEVATQVAHDIRSPLAALNMVTSSILEIPEEKRLMIRNSIQRINDISNDLLSKGKQSSSELNLQLNAEVFSGPILLPALIDSLVSEKRIQYRDQIQVQIQSDLKNSFGDFVLADGKELMRVLSNLINNSVEAFANGHGEVIVSVEKNINVNSSESTTIEQIPLILISIKDNGKGIPENILEKLGNAGVSFGKEGTQSGSGIGIYHAKKTIEEFGGQFKIISQVGIGTEIQIYLPKIKAPDWFLESLKIHSNSQIISLDDDISIHQIWKGRLSSMNASAHQIQLMSFTSAKEFKKYTASLRNTKSKESCDIKNLIYLIDYELLGQNTNGLKVIEDLGLRENVTLVTSRYEEPQIQQKCQQLGIKLLPKSLAGFVPIQIVSETSASTDNETLKKLVTMESLEENCDLNTKIHSNSLSKYDLCLIDDDKLLVHSIWGMVAKEKGLNIKMFDRPEDFLSEAGNIDKTTPVYVDVSLANNVNGIDVATSIYEQGFENINLATGYDSETIKAPSFIRQVVGKDFPL